jgi:hypothetical protein
MVSLFGPNIEKMTRSGDVDGLLRIVGADKHREGDIRTRKRAVDALCSLDREARARAREAVVGLCADPRFNEEVRAYVQARMASFVPPVAPEPVAPEKGPRLVCTWRGVDNFYTITDHNIEWTRALHGLCLTQTSRHEGLYFGCTECEALIRAHLESEVEQYRRSVVLDPARRGSPYSYDIDGSGLHARSIFDPPSRQSGSS